MLCSAAIIGSLASSLRSLYPAPASLPPVVIDPVTISTSGHTLLPTSAITALKAQIIPLGFVLTPNVLEAEMLLSDEGAHGEGLAAKSKTLAEGQRRITDLGAMLASAKDLAGLGCPNVLLKGGHLALGLPVVKAQLRALQQAGALGPDDVFWPEDEGIRILKSINGSSPDEKVVVDVLWESAAAKCTAIVSRLISTKNTHGTGCTLSAALAVYLGKGLSGGSCVLLLQGSLLWRIASLTRTPPLRSPRRDRPRTPLRPQVDRHVVRSRHRPRPAQPHPVHHLPPPSSVSLPQSFTPRDTTPRADALPASLAPP